MTMADTQTVRIDKLVYGGDGLARLDSGEVVFVPFVAPGESAQITLENPAQKIKHGTVCALEEASSERVKPPCSVFGECGGCQWQHLSATAQADWKRQIVEESLVRIGKLKSVVVNPAITPPDESARWHYRNKAEWIVSRENPEQPRLAYARLKSHDPVAFDHCWIIPEAMNQLARALETSPGILAQTERVTVRSNTQ